MSPTILRARRGDGPCRGFEVYFGICHRADFLAPLCGEDQEPDDYAVVVVLAGIPDGSKLGRCEHPVTRDFFGRFVRSDNWVRFRDTLTHAPREKGREICTAPGRVGPAGLSDAVEMGGDISAANAGDGRSVERLPVLQQVTFNLLV